MPRQLTSSEARTYRAARWAALRSLNYTIGQLNAGNAAVAQVWMGVNHPMDLRELARRLGVIHAALAGIHQDQIVFDASTNSHTDWYAEVDVTLRGAAHSITLAHPFFDAPTYGNDSRAGTLIHEVSHFNDVLGTDDNADGRAACLRLVRQAQQHDGDLNSVITNADSWQYLVEGIY
ncbi:M35 family metallo-endopeptidase [Pseudomonas sp. CBZ-4]|uniref:M35 family metallo-endopeptidase n=1 Tax=Pseudomonas sp. CBZ-4 TaxID=1163065 RepID=UPI00034DEF27|nr:M35 family metallo-endopeptidase [Pseudomonas sp. CBZ-4]